jgi:hypothetical protein
MAGRFRMYRSDKRRKEEARKSQREAKRQRRIERAASGQSGPEIEELPAPEAQAQGPVEYVWLSPTRNRTLTTPTASRPLTGPPDDWILLTDLPTPPSA